MVSESCWNWSEFLYLISLQVKAIAVSASDSPFGKKPAANCAMVVFWASVVISIRYFRCFLWGKIL